MACYLLSTRSEGQYVSEQVRTHLDEAYRSAGIAYYIEHANISTSSEVLARVVRQRPRHFLLLCTVGKTYAVFRVDLPRR